VLELVLVLLVLLLLVLLVLLLVLLVLLILLIFVLDSNLSFFEGDYSFSSSLVTPCFSSSLLRSSRKLALPPTTFSSWLMLTSVLSGR